jgi:hypothetical protein
MILKRKIQSPREYIGVGMAFFLIAMLLNMVADGRLIGAFFTSMIHDKSLLDTIQSIAAGFSIPISCASIFFNVRGLIMLRSR